LKLCHQAAARPRTSATPGIIRAVRLAHHVASREQTDIAFKGLQDSKEERGEPQRGPSVTTRRHRHTDARLTSSRHPPRMTQNWLLIVRSTSNTSQLSCESSCRWTVSDTVLGWGSRPLVFFARYLAGRLERPAVLPCVAQTGVVSPVGGDQAPRYHPWGLQFSSSSSHEQLAVNRPVDTSITAPFSQSQRWLQRESVRMRVCVRACVRFGYDMFRLRCI